jgi:HupE/UreJ protein
MRFTSTANSLGGRHGLAAIAAFFLLVGSRASAHPVAQGTMVVDVSEDKVRVEIIVSMEEVLVQSALSPPSGAGGNSTDELSRRHGDYLLGHVRVVADGQPLAGRLINVKPPSSQNTRPIYEFEYSLTAKPAEIRVEQDILNEFDYAPGNRWEATFVVRVLQMGVVTLDGFLLTSRAPLVVRCSWQQVSKPEAAGINKWRLVVQYVRYGIHHILTGYDHLLFIAGLVLAVVTVWDLIKIITAFTVAHSITLTLSVLHLVRLSPRVVEPMIAFSIVFVAAQNVFWPKRTRGTGRLAIAFFFGLFHGLGFAGGLLEAMEGMAGLTIGLAILAFSVGIEIGHQVVVLPVFALLKVLRSGPGGAPRFAERTFRYGSIVIAIAGSIYFLSALRLIR